MAKTLIVRISSKFQERLERLSEKTKSPPSFHIEEMLEIFFDEYEEACIAKKRMSMQNDRYHTSKTVRKLLDLQMNRPNSAGRSNGADKKEGKT